MASREDGFGFDRLSLDERLALVEAIWDSIAAEAGAVEVPEWHKVELDKRLAAHAANPRAGASWEEVKARLQDRVGGPS